MDRKKRRVNKLEDDQNVGTDDEGLEDVIATIHILKNKNQVKKRVVTRHVKDTE